MALDLIIHSIPHLLRNYRLMIVFHNYPLLLRLYNNLFSIKIPMVTV